MQDIFKNYIQSISSKFSHEETTEMGYRADFEVLLKGIFDFINVRRIDHDAKAEQGNKPDFVVFQHVIPILYIETKDIGISLDKVEKSEQMRRYYGYTNLVLTDYLEFRFYRNGLYYVEPIKIAEYNLKTRKITPIPDNYEYLARTLTDFTQSQKEPIKSGEHLAKIMGGKAQRIRDNIKQFLAEESNKNEELLKIYKTIKKLLVHDLTTNTFADMYAQTLVYGLFAARYHDEDPESFTRQEARDLIPKSNPLLRHFFDHIVGPNFDKRLEYIVNELCEVFSHADVNELMREYYNNNLTDEKQKGLDPVIHFYEDFLKEYDPILRKKMGAYYTPVPVVQFIVRSVDYLLKKEFGLDAGLADTSKIETGIHRVQILDPAVGTGTFISAVINLIYSSLLKSGQKGRWPTYVHNDLLPRIHGFELMMAPYTIAHLKLAMAFGQTGFKYFNRRLGIYLTNSLEKAIGQGELFTAFGLAESIAKESKEAAVIKNETPIMVVIGNPPYSAASSNETEYANGLVAKYKVEPGGKQKLQERKHWLNDDYVKFIAFAEDMISKNDEGIIGFITNHGYLDNPTFRGMRWNLMDTFDSIYVIDLHGNAKKKEISPNGSKDENVFVIQQGVSIMLAVKTRKKKKGDLAKVYRFDMWGKRYNKFDQLNNHSFEDIKWTPLEHRFPNLFFTQSGSIRLEEEYQKGFSVNKLFSENVSGIVTMGDGFAISDSKGELENRLEKLQNERPTEMELNNRYNLGKNYAKWLLGNLENIVVDDNAFTQIDYRPFDTKWTYFDNKVLWRWREKIMRHMLNGKNISLIASRINRQQSLGYFFIAKHISDFHILDTAGDSTFQFPLYLYADDGSRVTNMKREIVERIEKNIREVSPENVLDYIYAVLYSPGYREKFKEFLKIDFPRVPYPREKRSFNKLVKLGTELRSLHLLESPKLNQFITTYLIVGTDTVEKLAYKKEKVFINSEQYFGNVPEIAWNFYIGGYQPAQKWLKDRKGRTLTNNNIEHYQKIIVALVETNRIMNEIDQYLF
ncbi:MAG: DNA methyltransferase [Actinobacteria bacterium]|nr:DNA methyltransferase [Actinomycetota bacterium]